MKQKLQFPTSELNLLFALLMASAGMMGAYTFILRGNIFCNAQTANVVLMSIALGQGKWADAVYYLIPMSAYLAGALIAEVLQVVLKNRGIIFKWNTYLIGIEIIMLFSIGFIPLTTPHHVVQIMINFIASMQFTSFKRAEGIPMATTFCTNHIRQIGISIATSITQKTTKPLKRGLVHFCMIMSFFVGGVILTLTTKPLQEMSIWLTLVPLIIVFALLINGDIRDYKDYKNQIKKTAENSDTSIN